MKNYLFAPFKNDVEKVETFNYFKNYLPKGHRHEFIMFIGRLESTYDAETMPKSMYDKLLSYNQDLERGCGVHQYREENEELRKEIKELKENASKYLREDASKIEELQADNKELRVKYNDLLKACKLLKEENEELKAENESLKHH